MKKIIDFMFRSRYTVALYATLISLLFSFFIGTIFFLIVKNDYLGCVLGIWWLFGAPLFTASILLIFTRLPEDLTFGFGAGIYYGMIFVVILMGDSGYEKPSSYVTGILISSAVSYIVWRTKFREQYRTEMKHKKNEAVSKSHSTVWEKKPPIIRKKVYETEENGTSSEIYCPSFRRTMGEFETKSLKKKLTRTRIVLCVVVILLIASLGETIYLWNQFNAHAETYYEAGYQDGEKAAQSIKTHNTGNDSNRHTYTYVYVTESGEKYHVATCRYAENAEAVALNDAIDRGYTPCSVCNPPRP